MKKRLCLCACCLLLVSSTACGSSSTTEPDRSHREIKLSVSSVPTESIQVSSSSAPSTAAVPSSSDLTRIPKAEQLPLYMQNNPKLYANLLENVMTLYYAGLLSGRVNSDVFTPRYARDVLPPPDASPQERKKMADYCTIGGALEFFGCDTSNTLQYWEMYNGTLPYFCYDRDAHIYPKETAPANHVLTLTSFDQTLYFVFRYTNNDTINRAALSYAAQNIDSYVKHYYHAIENGTLTDSQSYPHTADVLPVSGASAEERHRCAENATIIGAIDAAGFYTVYAPYITSLGYNKKSSLFTLPDFHNPDIIALPSADTPLSFLHF